MNTKPPIRFKGSEEEWNAMTVEQQQTSVALYKAASTRKSKLLRPKAESKFESLAPVAVEIFVHGDQVPQVIADCSDALAQGLLPVSFALINNSVVLRLERPEAE